MNMVETKTTLKQKLVIILGILYILYRVTSIVLNLQSYNSADAVIYLASTFIQFTCMAISMILITFRKKTIALILTITALLICLLNQYVIPYGEVDSFAKTLYYMLEYILLVVYILGGDDKNRNSLIWCGLFIVSTILSVFEIANYFSVKNLMLLIQYLPFYLVGYSPDKWYERKKVPNEAQA